MFESILEQIKNASPEVLQRVESEIRNNVSQEDMDATLAQFPELRGPAGLPPVQTSVAHGKVHAVPTAYTMSDTSNLSLDQLKAPAKGKTIGSLMGRSSKGNDEVAPQSHVDSKTVLKYAGIALVVIGCATVLYMSYKYFKVGQRIMNLLSGHGFVTNKTAYERGAEPALTEFYTVAQILRLSEDTTLKLLKAIREIDLGSVGEWYETKKSVAARAENARAASYETLVGVRPR